MAYVVRDCVGESTYFNTLEETRDWLTYDLIEAIGDDWDKEEKAKCISEIETWFEKDLNPEYTPYVRDCYLTAIYSIFKQVA